MELLIGIVVSLAAVEIIDRHQQIVSAIVKLATHALPYEKAKKRRCHEEWTANALASKGRVSAILAAFACFWSTASILVDTIGHRKQNNTTLQQKSLPSGKLSQPSEVTPKSNHGSDNWGSYFIDENEEKYVQVWINIDRDVHGAKPITLTSCEASISLPMTDVKSMKKASPRQTTRHNR